VAVLIVLLPAWPGAGEPMESSTGARAGPESIWGPDVRMTQNASEDEFPSLEVDWQNSAHLFWERGGMDRMYLQPAENGSFLTTERSIIKAPPTSQHSGQRTPNMGIDPDFGISVVWTDKGLFGPMYQPFWVNGTPKTAPMDVAPMADDPHTVSIAMGRNGRAYFVYEDVRDGLIEMAYISENEGSYWLHTGYTAGLYASGSTIGVGCNGNVHVFYKNATQTGLWHTMFSSDGQMMINDKSISTSVAGFGPDSALPQLAFSSDGNIHLLQASRVNGAKSLYYSKLSWDGTNLTDDIRIADSADFGDLCVDEELGVHIVYGNKNDGEIYYVQLAPGKENDTFIPERLTYSPGASRDPTIVARSSHSLMVAWVDERDGNAEIHYKSGLRPGVELEMDPEYKNQLTPVHLKHDYDYPMSVRNLGRSNDTARLGLSVNFNGMEGGIGPDYNGSGWKLWLDEYSVPLGPLGEKDFTVHIETPDSGYDCAYIEVRVTADSSFDLTLQSVVRFRPMLSLTHNIELEGPDGVHEILPYCSTAFNITISSWDYKEAVDLCCTSPPGWSAVLNNTLVMVEPWGTVNVTLTVTPFAETPGNSTGVLDVTAVSVSDLSVKDRVKVRTRVLLVTNISITPDWTERWVLPGETAEFALSFEKTGNDVDATELSLGFTASAAGWNVLLGANGLSLKLNQPNEVVLRVAAPAQALQNDRLEVLVYAQGAGQELLAFCTVTIHVRLARELEVYIADETLRARPGERTGATVSVVNRGNGAESLYASPPVKPAGWQVRFERSDGSVVAPEAPFTVGAGETAVLTLVVIPSYDSTTGRYFVTGILSDGYGKPYELRAMVEVLQVFDAAVEAVEPEAVVRPGEQARFVIAASNRGNGPEVLQFTASGLPAGWGAPAFEAEGGGTPGRILLAPFCIGKMTVRVDVPAGYAENSVEFLVRAESPHNFLGSVRLYIRITHVNLELSNLTATTQNPSPGQVVRIQLLVSNTGDLNIENVAISVQDGDRVLLSRNLGRLDSKSSWVYVYEWTAVEGTHTLMFVANAPNGTAEDDVLDNTAEVTIRVDTDKAGGMPAWQGVVVAAAVATVLTIVGLLALRRRKRKTGGRRPGSD